MADIKRIDTDGVRSILDVGQLAVDDYTGGSDVGRIWTGDGSVNRKLAFHDELGAGGSIEAKTYDELVATVPTDNTIYWYIGSEKYVYWHPVEGTWKYFNDDSNIKQTGAGTGVAGTWTESWEVANDATTNWISDDFGNIQDGTESGKWNRHRYGTPSSHTGPSSAADDTWYLYSEMSSNGHFEDFNLSTTNFRKLTEVKFKYHMYGSQCGIFKLSTIVNGVITKQWVVEGNQGNQWNDVVLDLSNSDAEEFVFTYENSVGWQADLAIDKIEITSV